MAVKPRADDRDRATEPNLYLPAGFTPPVENSRIARLWERLFNHGVDPGRE
jgi:hypothetical protein